MKQFRVVKKSNVWSAMRLMRETEMELEKLSAEGFEIVSVSFGVNIWLVPTAYITISRDLKPV